MSVDRQELLRRFDALQDQSPAEQEASLDELAGEQPELAAELRRLLATDVPEGFLSESPIDLGGILSGEALVGHTLGHQQILAPLKGGGMGLLYQARDLRSGARTVVKRLQPYLRGDVHAAERFQRESEALARLDHPSVVPVVDSGEEQGDGWFAMPYIDGHDLSVELARQLDRGAGRRLDQQLLLPEFGSEGYVASVVKAAGQLAEALDHAHQEGILHRDIKPQNVLLDRAGRFHLVDFGLARFESSDLTASQDALGTLQYMSPEQVRAVRREVDVRSDVYSLGVVLYELLCLVPPYRAETQVELIRRIASGGHRWLGRVNPALPTDLVRVCERAIAWDPVDRYPSAADLAADLRRVANFETIHIRGPSWRSRVRSWSRRHPVRASLAGALPLAALLTWLALGWRVRATQEHEWLQLWDQVLELPDWEGHDAELVQARTALQEARARGGLSETGHERARALEDRLRADLARRLERIEGLRRSGLGGEPLGADGVLRSEASAGDLLASLALANRGLAVHPEDPRLLALGEIASSFVPVRLDWSADADPAWVDVARVQALRRDPLTDRFDAPRDLGPLPVAQRLPPGPWRLVVSAPGAAPAEFDRELRTDRGPAQLAVRLRPREARQPGFVLLPAARLVWGPVRPLGCTITSDAVDLPAFWIGEAEVSNGEYLAFLESTGHRTPKLWREAGYAGDWRLLPGVDGDERWLELPATGMARLDMVAYAEWAGARLPTHHESEYARRGPELSRGVPAGLPANLQGPEAVLPTNDFPAKYREYMRRVLPVRAEGYRHPPFGLFHALGNVAEPTSSAIAEVKAGVLTRDATRHIHLGGSWLDTPGGDVLVGHGHWGNDEAYARLQTGFRLARSEPVR